MVNTKIRLIIFLAAKDGEALYTLYTQKLYILYIFSKNKTRSLLCSDHELLLAKFRLKLKKVGKTARPCRHDLHQIPYDYTMEVTNRSKGLDLTNRVPEELWMEVHDIVQEAVIKIIPKKKKRKKGK